MNQLPPVFGCYPDPPDKRDFIFEDVMGAPPPAMPTFEHGYDVEEKYGALRDELQGNTLGCVTFGGTDDIEMSAMVTTKKIIQLSQRDAYSQIWIRPNGASSPRDFYKLANQKGICEDDFLPTNPGPDLQEEWLRSRQGESPDSIANALKWRIGPYYSIASLQIDAIAQAVFQNDGCGGAYMPVGANLGHFIFFRGYGIRNGLKALKIRDSYVPHEKWITLKNNQYYLGSQPISLFSIWTFQAGNWGEDMPKLLRKKNTQEVFLVLNNRRYWVKAEPNFEDLVNSQPISGLGWDKVEEVDIFTQPFDGDIIGKSNFSDLLKQIFGSVK